MQEGELVAVRGRVERRRGRTLSALTGGAALDVDVARIRVVPLLAPAACGCPWGHPVEPGGNTSSPCRPPGRAGACPGLGSRGLVPAAAARKAGAPAHGQGASGRQGVDGQAGSGQHQGAPARRWRWCRSPAEASATPACSTGLGAGAPSIYATKAGPLDRRSARRSRPAQPAGTQGPCRAPGLRLQSPKGVTRPLGAPPGASLSGHRRARDLLGSRSCAHVNRPRPGPMRRTPRVIGSGSWRSGWRRARSASARPAARAKKHPAADSSTLPRVPKNSSRSGWRNTRPWWPTALSGTGRGRGARGEEGGQGAASPSAGHSSAKVGTSGLSVLRRAAAPPAGGLLPRVCSMASTLLTIGCRRPPTKLGHHSRGALCRHAHHVQVGLLGEDSGHGQ